MSTQERNVENFVNAYVRRGKQAAARETLTELLLAAYSLGYLEGYRADFLQDDSEQDDSEVDSNAEDDGSPESDG